MTATEPTREETVGQLAHIVMGHTLQMGYNRMVATDVIDFLTSPEGEPHLRALASEILATQAASAEKAEAERDRAHQALWDIYAALGFDTDGDETPAALLAGMGNGRFCSAMVSDAHEARRDWEEGLAEAEAALAEERAKVERVRALAEEHWDWKAGLVLAERLRAAIEGKEEDQ